MIKENKINLNEQLTDDTKLVVFDFETTGFSADKNQIIEIGAVKIDKTGKEHGRFQTFLALDPKMAGANKVPKKIVELTGITDEMLVGQPTIKQGLLDFLEFIGDDILVAHNSDFDSRFMASMMRRCEIGIWSFACLDTMTLAKNANLGTADVKLGTLAKFFELSYDADAHHRADYDADLTGQLLARLLELPEYSDATLSELIVKSSGTAQRTPSFTPQVKDCEKSTALARLIIKHGIVEETTHYGNVVLNQIHSSVIDYVRPMHMRK